MTYFHIIIFVFFKFLNLQFKSAAGQFHLINKDKFTTTKNMWNLISIALLPVNNNFRRFFLFFSFFLFGIQKSVQEMYTFLSTYKKYITRWPDIPLQSTKISTNVYLAWTKNKSLIYTDIYECKWSVFGNKTLKCTLFSPEAQRKTGTRNI